MSLARLYQGIVPWGGSRRRNIFARSAELAWRCPLSACLLLGARLLVCTSVRVHIDDRLLGLGSAPQRSVPHRSVSLGFSSTFWSSLGSSTAFGSSSLSVFHRSVPHRSDPHRSVPHRSIPHRSVPLRFAAPHRLRLLIGRLLISSSSPSPRSPRSPRAPLSAPRLVLCASTLCVSAPRLRCVTCSLRATS